MVRSGVVLLLAAVEVYVEALFEEAAPHIFAKSSGKKLDVLFRNTSKRLHSASYDNIEMLYFNLGLPWVLSEIKWQKFSNDSVRRAFTKLVKTRHDIAHGKFPGVTLQQLKKWKVMVEKFAPILEARVSNHIADIKGAPPGW